MRDVFVSVTRNTYSKYSPHFYQLFWRTPERSLHYSKGGRACSAGAPSRMLIDFLPRRRWGWGGDGGEPVRGGGRRTAVGTQLRPVRGRGDLWRPPDAAPGDSRHKHAAGAAFHIPHSATFSFTTDASRTRSRSRTHTAHRCHTRPRALRYTTQRSRGRTKAP